VVQGLNLEVKPGECIAFVGHSGCGKSTIIGLLERFYDPVHGTIEIDDVPIHEFNEDYLRSEISLVEQEPKLFNCSIKENIELGIPLDERDTLAEDAYLEAAKSANAHNFIANFVDRYDTNCGKGGASMSGGQKQRIAIARSIIRDPKILLLDEATSALDSKSEEIVQKALNEIIANNSCTCIIIAHHLKTIRNCNTIYVIEDHKVLEYGNHDELMAKEHRYFDMYNLQH
jgi:ATP-binding cassette subfamily B (MDR/TAP) protein 1